MKLVVLGSGTAMPLPDRAPPGFLVSVDETLLLLDCGSGTLQRLARLGVHPRMLDALFITHPHLDHIGDLAALLFSLKLPGCELERPLTLHTGPDMRRYLEGLRATFGAWVEPGGAPLLHEEHTSGRFEVGALRCRVAQVEHHASSVGVQIESPDGGRMAYLGDTALCDGAIELCRDVDVVVVECSMPDEHPLDGHMTPAQIAALAAEARPRSLLLTHLYPPALDADILAQLRGHGCRVPATIAHDGLGVSVEP